MRGLLTSGLGSRFAATAGLAARPDYFERDLLAYLNTFGLPVYPGHIPQGQSPPALSFLIVGADREYGLSGPTGNAEVHVQVAASGRSYAQVADVVESLRLGLSGFRQRPMGRTYISVILLGPQLAQYEPGVDASDRGVHTKVSEFTVFHRESTPRP